MAGDHGRVFFLASEAAAGLHLHNTDALGWHVEEAGERGVHVIGTLHRPPHRYAVAGIGDREHPHRLDVELFLGAGLVHAFDDHGVAGGERGVDVSLRHRVTLEGVVFAPDDLAARQRIVDGKYRRQRLVFDRHPAPRLVGPRAIGMGDEDDGLFRMIDLLEGEIRLVVGDQLDAVAAGNVGRGDDDVVGPVDPGVEADGGDAAARNGAAHGDAVQHARLPHVVHVERLPGHLGAPFLAPDRPSHLFHPGDSS